MIFFDGLLKELQSNFLMSEVLLLVHDINNGTIYSLFPLSSGLIITPPRNTWHKMKIFHPIISLHISTLI